MKDNKLSFKLDKYKAPKGQLFSLEGRSFDFDNDRYSIFPGFCDVHVHFREPGFSYKETIATGCAAAAAGGYTAVCAMPNLDPAPDSPEHLRAELELIERDASVKVLPYAAISLGEKGERLSEMEALAPYVAGFSDDGHGLQSDELMEQAMLRAKALGKLIVAHCEDNSLLRGGYIHQGDYARAHGHRGICSESEYAQVERDLKLVEKTGCAYHVCHVSTKESVELIRKARARGLDVSCETAPHYLLLDESMLQEDGRFKMNPPVRSREDRLALLEGIKDGTIGMIATDHAPHSQAEKSRGLENSAFGIVGLETAFPLLYTNLVLTGEISLQKLLELMCWNPRQRFGIPMGEEFSLWDLGESYRIDPAQFKSLGRSTPFQGWHVRGRCHMTVYNGKAVYNR